MKGVITMKKLNLSKKALIIGIILIVGIIVCGTVAIVSVCNQQRALNDVQVSDVTIELDNQTHTVKATDFIQENTYDKYGNYTAQFDTAYPTEITVEANQITTKQAEIVLGYEKIPYIKSKKSVKINVVDTTAPEFTEKTDTITINKGEELDVTSRFKATDLSGDVELKADDVDVNKVGEQVINVYATDASGNVAQLETKVVVNEPEKVQEEQKEDATEKKTSSSTSKSQSSSTSKSTSSSSKSGSYSDNKSSNNNNSSSSNKKSNASSSSKQEPATSQSSNVSSCTNNNNHSMKCGNIGKWFNNRNDIVEYYKSEVNKWNNKIDNDEITYNEYLKNVPSGYECWSCSYCGKWTGNFKHY